MQETPGDPGLIPGSGRSPGIANANPLQYSCLKIPWTEEPGELQLMELQRDGQDWAHMHMYIFKIHMYLLSLLKYRIVPFLWLKTEAQLASRISHFWVLSGYILFHCIPCASGFKGVMDSSRTLWIEYHKWFVYFMLIVSHQKTWNF